MRAASITKAAIEIALFDALGKLYNIPVYCLLGGPYRRDIDLVGGLGLDEGPEVIGAHAKRLKKEGFDTFKIKIGQKDWQSDVLRLESVRSVVGGETNIRVDGNACYSFVDARQVLNEMAKFNITDAEQPLARGDLKSLAELRKSVGIPIAIQESVSSPDDALKALEENAADLLKVKLTHIGGFTLALQVAAIVGARGLPVVVGQGSACTTLLSAAEMHLHVALKNAQPAGEMTGFLRLGEQDIFGPINVKRGKAALPNGPGIGIPVNEEKLRQKCRELFPSL